MNKFNRSFEFSGICVLGFCLTGLVIVIASALTRAFDPAWCMLALGPAILAVFAMFGIFAYEILTEK